ncbi:MAG TPA: hypothetical protein VHM91_00760 [Verrucomicrobiales bacterium]|nr:hypothetical protein [Verrucomicrobiales bacterium]
MTDLILLARLRPALERMRRYRMFCGGAIGLAVAALMTALLLPFANTMADAAGGSWSQTRLYLLPCGILLGVLGAMAGWMFKPNAVDVARRLEKQYPDLEGRLLTALQQVPGEGGKFRFLQEHLFCETLHHSTQRDWNAVVKESAVRRMRAVQVVVLAAFVVLWALLPWPGAIRAGQMAQQRKPGEVTVTVTPGDVEVERGASLVLLARFDNALPGSAELVMGETSASEKRLPLKRSLNDPVFGGTVPEVKESFSYRVAWEGGESPKFKVRAFDYPKLERSDVTLTYPEYTKQPAKHIEDMRHTSAVEGTRIDLDLTLNKPVASAVLQPRKSKTAKEENPALPALKLEISPDKAVAMLRGYTPAKSARYELVLTDADGRQSRQAAQFSFDVVPNKVPELKLATPKGDQKPSALQELIFSGTVWDDFGVVASGLEVTTPGGQTVTLNFSKEVPGRETRSFQELLQLEALSAVPDQLFAWHAWAEDIGPDGKVRRTRGDLFYAEIRPFEEVFRQGESQENSEQQNREQQQQQGENQGQGAAAKLAELQKQIINATWKLQRSQGAAAPPDKIGEDIRTVHDSQGDARKQAEEASAAAAEQPQTAAYWQTALKEMDKALERLDKAATAPPEVATALLPEQTAYQALLKLRAREYDVSRSQRQQQQQQGGRQQGGNEGSQRQQEQLNQMDLAKEENRYETQREAQAQQTAERREQMQVINRLKELAQRQQDVNEKLKELQTALNEAKTEAEKEEARRQLKRLEEEQRRMLADADELGQKMEQRQNQSEAGDQREQLDQARQNMEKAAEATEKGEAGKALAAGTRAKEQMQQMREDLRKQSATAFSDELRDMRAEARDIARKQEEIARQMKPSQPAEPDPFDPKPARTKEAPSLASAQEPADIAKQLDQQQQRTGDLVKRATELSEEAEPSEPSLSRQIYEAARQFAQDDSGAVKETQQQMVREGRLESYDDQFDDMRRLQESEQAGKALRLTAQLLKRNQQEDAERTGEKARENINRLRQGVEKAAESVIGDDTAALRLAESQLQAAAEAVQKEIEQQQRQGGETKGEPQEGQQPPSGKNPGNPRETETAQNPRREGQPQEGSQPNQGEGRQPGGQQPREGNAQTAQNQERPQEGQQGNRPGQARPPGERQPSQPRENRELAQEQNGQPQEGQPAESSGQGRQPGEQRSPGEGQPGQNREGARTAANAGDRQRRTPAANGGGGGGGPEESNRFRPTAQPLTGEGFTNWSDTLREAEEMVDQPDLRDGIAAARERARQMRAEAKRDLKKPDWAVVQLEILKPLVEVRQRLREELARRDSDKALVPVDRDPVPAQFSENVRRYYEQLGKDQ